MRPLPLILLFVALAAALVVGLLFVGRGTSAPSEAARNPAPALGASDAGEPAPSPLDATGARAAETSRAATAVAPAASEPARSAKKEVPTVRLSGRVLGNLGKPVEGATVYAAEANDFLGAPLDEIDPDRMGWIRRASATTDHDGRFAIRAEARGKVVLAVRAAGFAPLDREFSITGVERDVGELALDASVVLAGRVVSANGRAVEGARISRVSSVDVAMPFFGGPAGATVATTNAQGEFRVDQLAAGPWHLLVTHADHPDHLETGEADRAGAVQSDLVVTLEDGSEIQGRIVGAPEDVRSKLSVRAVARGVNGEGVVADSPNAFASSVRTVACAPDGSFTLKGLKPSQRYRLTAQQKTRDFFRGARSAAVTAQAGDRGVELAFQPETAIVFQVVDATSGLPVVGLNVQAGYAFTMPLLDDDGRPVKRFPDGRVRYGGLPPAPRPAGQGIVQAGSASSSGLKLRIEAPGYQVLERGDVAVIDGQDNDLGVIKLERAPVLTVLVLDDATSAPIADAAVSLVEETPTTDHRHARMAFSVDEADGGDADMFAGGAAHRARTDADGRASVTSMPGKTGRLRVRHAGYAQHESEPIAFPLDQSIERTVRLSLGGSVTVEVVDSKGIALAGVEVDHRGPNADAGEVSFSNRDAATDADGKIAFDHLASGQHRFRLRQGAAGGVLNVDGGGRAMVRRVSRNGGPEEEGWSAVDVDEHTVATVRLVAPERGTLAGRVSEGGKPLANATIRVSPKGEDATPMPFRSGGRNTRTDARGDYTFDGVDEGEYTVAVEHATRVMAYEAPTRVRAGDNRFDLDLPVAIVEGTVTGEDGKPVAGVRIHAERAPSSSGGPRRMSIALMVTSDGGDEPEVSMTTGDGGGSTVVSDPDGRYALRGVLADVELVVEGNGKDTQPARSGAFTVGADQTKKGIDLKLERGGTIAVSVQRPGGAAAGGFLARATLDGDPVPKVQMVGPSGTAKLTGLKPGKWHVHLDQLQGPLSGNTDAPIPEREVEVKIGETAHATFEVP